jgi:hypothetical protein
MERRNEGVIETKEKTVFLENREYSVKINSLKITLEYIIA